MSTPEAQRNASKAYRKRLKEAGSKQIGFVLSPDALTALERLAKVHGSKAAAVNAALISAAKVEEERSAAYYAIYGNTLTAEHVPIQRLDVDAEHRLAGPEKPSGWSAAEIQGFAEAAAALSRPAKEARPKKPAPKPKVDTSGVMVHPSLKGKK